MSEALPLAVIVLAAGRGTRFPEVPSKVLAELDGRPLVGHVLEAVAELRPARTIVVVGHAKELVRAAVTAGGAETVEQPSPPLGTGHAVLAARAALGGPPHRVLVLNGDVPLVRAATLRRLVHHLDKGADAVVLSAVLDDAGAYGRVVRSADGTVDAIVEAADASEEQRAIHEINVGCYAFRAPQVFEVLDGVGRDNAQGEIYLTDAVRAVVAGGGRVAVEVLGDPTEGQGVNSAAELAELAATYGRR